MENIDCIKIKNKQNKLLKGAKAPSKDQGVFSYK